MITAPFFKRQSLYSYLAMGIAITSLLIPRSWDAKPDLSVKAMVPLSCIDQEDLGKMQSVFLDHT
ncbi:hypothetical protein HE1_00903 [Holospora elegans E1]|uniref:Uncharacterized protein n=1 Tax=Holospora elegans E1 TaxID=1427503 RepID=A0A023DZN7_9PROT|nr:hypothetical protein HE1_00903 [Holospora elegans E1]